MVKEYHILEAQKPKIRAPRDSVFGEVQVLHLLSIFFFKLRTRQVARFELTV